MARPLSIYGSGKPGIKGPPPGRGDPGALSRRPTALDLGVGLRASQRSHPHTWRVLRFLTWLPLPRTRLKVVHAVGKERDEQTTQGWRQCEACSSPPCLGFWDPANCSSGLSFTTSRSGGPATTDFRLWMAPLGIRTALVLRHFGRPHRHRPRPPPSPNHHVRSVRCPSLASRAPPAELNGRAGLDTTCT